MKTTQKKAKISLGFQKKSASETVSFGNGTVTGCTGNAFFPSMPVPLGTISAQCTAVKRPDEDSIRKHLNSAYQTFGAGP